MTSREIQFSGQGFYYAMSPWAGDFVDDFDWDDIREDYNEALAALAPEGVTWGWSEDGAWCYADVNVPLDDVYNAWESAIEEGIDFETIARRHDITEN